MPTSWQSSRPRRVLPKPSGSFLVLVARPMPSASGPGPVCPSSSPKNWPRAVASSSLPRPPSRWAVGPSRSTRIYKAGADPVWVEGLDLLGPIGLEVAVIPHYDNAEGGTHDTRYCYLGEGRLRMMEAQLPPGGWVLGVDEHTACIFDLDAGTVEILGLGSVTVRRHGESVAVPTGNTMGIEELVSLSVAGVAGNSGASGGVGSAGRGGGAKQRRWRRWRRRRRRWCERPGPERRRFGPGCRPPQPSDGRDHRLGAAFDDALRDGTPGRPLRPSSSSKARLHAWSADTFESDELDRAHAGLRRTLLRLGEASGAGLRDPRQVAAPWVEALLTERDAARSSRRFADADRIRAKLEAAGVEVRDTPAGTEWELRPGPGPGPGTECPARHCPPGAALRGAALHGASLRGASLPGASLPGASARWGPRYPGPGPARPAMRARCRGASGCPSSIWVQNSSGRAPLHPHRFLSPSWAVPGIGDGAFRRGIRSASGCPSSIWVQNSSGKGLRCTHIGFCHPIGGVLGVDAPPVRAGGRLQLGGQALRA